MALNWDQNIPPTPPYKEFGTLSGLARNLKEIFVKLNDAFSEENFPTSKERMGKIDQQLWRSWEQQNLAMKRKSGRILSSD